MQVNASPKIKKNVTTFILLHFILACEQAHLAFGLHLQVSKLRQRTAKLCHTSDEATILPARSLRSQITCACDPKVISYLKLYKFKPDWEGGGGGGGLFLRWGRRDALLERDAYQRQGAAYFKLYISYKKK